jgi:TniQ
VADGSAYGGLDLSLPEFTGRTRLYHQRPFGIGTPMVESLTGYIVRLADAHVVTPGALIFKELGRTVAASETGHGSRRCYPTFAYDAHTLNGMTDRAEKWAVAVGAATGVESVRFLTMLPWRHVFSAQGVTRTKLAWCARCYRQWRTEGVETYEPLLWMLPVVSICPLHQQLLTTTCPHCGREPHIVACRSRPGHCSRCGGWLGVQTDEPANGGDAADWKQAGSIGEAVATLLARAPTLERPPLVELLKINLRACLDDLAGGNESLFQRAAGLGPKTVAGWLGGRLLPKLDSLLTICCRLGVPLLHFITEPMSSGNADWEHAREVVARYQALRSRRAPVVRAALAEALRTPKPRSLSDIAWQVGFKHENSLRKYDPEAFGSLMQRQQDLQASTGRSNATDPIPSRRVEEALEIALRQNPPPSLRDVSLSLSVPGTSWLVERFPVPCRALVQRSRDYGRTRRLEVEEVLKTALVEEPPPTVKDVANRAGHSPQMLRTWFPDLYDALSARAPRRRNWWLAKVHSFLEAAVTQEPPPSGEAVASGAGVASRHLRKLFPNPWRELVARHAAHKRQEGARNRREFQETVRGIAQDLLVAGRYPSRRRVRALLPELKLSGAHLIVREVKKAVAEFSGGPAAVASSR